MINTQNAAVRARVIDWLLADFGYGIPRPDDPESAFGEDSRLMLADRYGSTSGLSVHGGSGRAVIAGCFQAKGVGPTPLVGIGGHPGHSHGCTSIEENVREAIYGEICAAEFPHRAIPVVAILDTGLMFSSPDATELFDQEVRRGILIRPAMLRAAHAERAPLFKRSANGYVNLQSDDVRRVRDVVERWDDFGTTEESALIDFFKKIAAQVAFGTVHRLFNGGYFTSNISISGALLDFGNMHALDDWTRACVLSNTPGFGSEWLTIRRAISSLAFFFCKYCSDEYRSLEGHVLQAFRSSYNLVFDLECLRIWNLQDQMGSGLANDVLAIIKKYFADQQKKVTAYKFGKKIDSSKTTNGWLFDGYRGSDSAGATEARVLQDLNRLIRRNFPCEQEWYVALSTKTAARYLRPRSSINRAYLLTQIRDIVASASMSTLADNISSFIDEAIDRGRRHWPRLPADLLVLAHVSRRGCSALACVDRFGKNMFWLEGLMLGGALYFFGQRIPPDSLSDFRVSIAEGVWSVVVPRIDKFNLDFETQLHLSRTIIVVPPFTTWY